LTATLSDGLLQVYDLESILSKEYVVRRTARPITPPDVFLSSDASKPETSIPESTNSPYLEYDPVISDQNEVEYREEYVDLESDSAERRSFPKKDISEVAWTSAHLGNSHSNNLELNVAQIPLNLNRLRNLLLNYGQYPSRYRALIWRYLLKLPENREAFSILVERPIHFSLHNLHRNYPITDASLFRKLEKYVD
jgi:hypothetical protein